MTKIFGMGFNEQLRSPNVPEISDHRLDPAILIQDTAQFLATCQARARRLHNIEVGHVDETNSLVKNKHVHLETLRQGQSCTKPEDLSGDAIDIGIVVFLGFYKEKDDSGKSSWHGKFDYDDQNQTPFPVAVELIKISQL